MIWLAWATSSTVQPIHVACHVIPERHHHGHTFLDGLAELWHATKLTVLLSEFSDDAERLVGVDGIISARTIKLLVTHSIWVDPAAIAICWANITLSFFLRATFHISAITANLLACSVHCVQCLLSCKFVCLPEIKLRAANTTASLSNVVIRILLVWNPLWLDVGLALDPFQITRALGITVASSILCASLPCVNAFVAIWVHLHKIDGTIQTTVGFRHVHDHRHFLANEIKLLVFSIFGDEEPCSHVDRIRALGDKPNLDTIVSHTNAIRFLPLVLGPSTYCTFLTTSSGCTIFTGHITRLCFPLVVCVAIIGCPSLVSPSPIGIQ